MSAVISTTKLHLNKRLTFFVPLAITAIVAVISVLISLLFWRAGSSPGTEGWIEGSRSNPGIFYSLAGFLAYLGVLRSRRRFPSRSLSGRRGEPSSPAPFSGP